MGIPAITILSHDRRIIRYDLLPIECLDDPISYRLLVGAPVAYSPPDFLESGSSDRVNCVPRTKMGCDLLFVPGRLNLRHQIRGADNVLAQAADQVNRAAIDQGDREDQIVMRVLHGD